ncbi:chromosome segregation protein SMC [Salinibacter altiplanensis]|uniref:chromosome segregation protein SMC n=1 Tax=Salinibacter altiplanensis TaxID=1803181 RepID=UPI000C9F1880|nr:chromosome segregation protein SMC [Salinibacter altiplanensis]
MYLTKLEVQGFKSFADETTLTFDPGVTTIVGPNGCGKSNIVDAIRWVIGEQRPTVLRSEKMENLIFNGTADRRPLGMAEVELTIENTDGVLPTEYAEVTIGRRLFRDGTSEYLMNGTTCRLKDITDLFMDTGMAADAYSVIELKMVDELVSGSTEDRRRMFEEAAGITRYKMRRRQALRKLEGTQSDLERIRDLTDEVSTQVERLEAQAETAQRYQEAETELRRLELLLTQVEYDRLTERQDELAAQETEHADRAEALAEDERVTEARLEDLRETLSEREDTLQERREALQEHRARVRELEAEQRLQRERLTRARDDREEAQQAQEEARERRTELTGEVQRLESALEQARPALDEAEATLEEARDERDAAKAAANELREDVRRHREKAEAAEDEHAEQRRALDQRTNRQELLEDERTRARTQHDDLAEKVEAFDARIEEAEAECTAAEQTLEEARSALAEATTERDTRQAALEDAREELRERKRRRDAAEAEVELLEGLVGSYDEFSDAVQFLAAEGLFDDLYTVADVLGCDDDVRVALDAALGDFASCVVVSTAQDARAAVDRLREASKGQTSFLVLDRLPDSPPSPSAPDGTVPLRTAVRTTDPAYTALADTLLHDCYLVDTLEEAEALAEGFQEEPRTVRIFARTGEWVDSTGVLRGGSRQDDVSPAASRLGRREQLARARDQHADLQAAVDEQEAAVAEAKAALGTITLAAHESAVEEAEATLADAEQRLERLRYERTSTKERCAELQERLDEIEAERAEHEDRVHDLRQTAEAAEEAMRRRRQERAEAEEALTEAEDRERTAVDAFSEAQVAAVEARNRVDNLEQDLERARDQIDEIDRQTGERAATLENLTATIEEALDEQTELDEQIEALREERKARDQSVEAAEEALQETKAQIDEVESRLRSIRQEREAALEQKNEAAVALTKVETRTQDLLDSMKTDFDRDLADDPASVPEAFDEAEAQSEVKSLRGTINALGDVNPLALEEYEEEKERLDFLQEQKTDLEEAEDTLLDTIQEINAKASERFMETFEEIKESFGTLFTELFGKGASAELQLAEPDDPIDSAIEIVAKPRGKRPVTLDQLSSGEKALTATALLFSIYLVKPSPFCVLDEVDAPLDDANVERFMSLVRRFEGDTQFVLVTHNQRTMDLSDRMYGVTMEEQGVSKLVGVEFDEAAELTG